MTDLPKVIRDQSTEAEIRADERGRVEREIAEWLDAMPYSAESHEGCMTAATIAHAIERGEYRKTEEDKL